MVEALFENLTVTQLVKRFSCLKMGSGVKKIYVPLVIQSVNGFTT
jgi:hypothetical protein